MKQNRTILGIICVMIGMGDRLADGCDDQDVVW